MDMRQLTTFRTLATTLSFTQTAATLNYVQSTVTAQIQALEEGYEVIYGDTDSVMLELGPFFWIEDLIAFSGADFQAVNVNEARIRGLEFTHGLSAGAWRSNLDLTLQDPEDRDADRDLLRRAEFKGSWALDYAPMGRWNVGAELVHVGERLDVGGVELASYTLINLRGRLRLGDRWHLEGRIGNLADRDYEPLVGFNAADRRVFVELGWRG